MRFKYFLTRDSSWFWTLSQPLCDIKDVSGLEK